METLHLNELPPDPDALIAQDLRTTQQECIDAPLRRRAAVVAAKNAGWSNYRISQTMPAAAQTVRVILANARNAGDLPAEPAPASPAPYGEDKAL